MKQHQLALMILVIGTLLFGGAIAALDHINPWVSNTATAVFVSALALYFLRGQLSNLFALNVRVVAFSIALAIAMVAATHLSYSLATYLFPALKNIVSALYADIAETRPGTAITVCLILIVVFAEELLWRGVAVVLCKKRYGSLATGLLVILLYTLPQIIGGNWVLIAAAIVAGSVFTAQRLYTKGLVAPLVTHAIWSACIFCLLPLG